MREGVGKEALVAERVGVHPHVARLVDAAVHNGEPGQTKLLLIYEYAGISLHACLQQHGFVPAATFVQTCLRQVARELQFLGQEASNT